MTTTCSLSFFNKSIFFALHIPSFFLPNLILRAFSHFSIFPLFPLLSPSSFSLFFVTLKQFSALLSLFACLVLLSTPPPVHSCPKSFCFHYVLFPSFNYSYTFFLSRFASSISGSSPLVFPPVLYLLLCFFI
jgi:hypothetical protein